MDPSQRDPAEGRPMPELPAEEGAADEADEIPREAIDEAERWDDVPAEDPEESTGIDAG